VVEAEVRNDGHTLDHLFDVVELQPLRELGGDVRLGLANHDFDVLLGVQYFFENAIRLDHSLEVRLNDLLSALDTVGVWPVD